jgi:hypothetical protein
MRFSLSALQFARTFYQRVSLPRRQPNVQGAWGRYSSLKMPWRQDDFSIGNSLPNQDDLKALTLNSSPWYSGSAIGRLDGRDRNAPRSSRRRIVGHFPCCWRSNGLSRELLPLS